MSSVLQHFGVNSFQIDYRILYKFRGVFRTAVGMSATWHTFFPGVKSKTVPAFRHKQILSPHYHETHFYTILKCFKRLKRNHKNHNYLYSSPSNYTYPQVSASIHANYNHL